MYRQNTYQEFDMGELLPVFRKPVAPGESLELDVSTWFESAPTSKYLAGGIASLYAFYCPNRLVWDQWVDFVAQPDTLTVPVTNASAPQWFERAGSHSVLFRRAFKLAYNQYFGSDKYGNSAWYSDITNDADVSNKALRTVDQMLGRILQQADLDLGTYEAPVTGTAPNQVATITLDEFRRSMAQAKMAHRAQMTGDKYVDAMLRLGVKLDWRVQQAPEFLGACHHDFAPTDSRGTYQAATPATGGAASVGFAQSRFQGRLRLQTKRKFFAEHGYVFVCLGVRPHVFMANGQAPADSRMIASQNFFMGDNMVGTDPVSMTTLTGVAGDAGEVFRFEPYLSGSNMVGQKTQASNLDLWVPNDVPPTQEDAFYPRWTPVPNNGSLTGFSLAAYSRCSASGPTPIRRNVV